MKKQFKRGLALVMTLFMLMTSWVFVAPTKAEAVNTGNYGWSVKVVMTDSADGWDNGDLKVFGKANNGKGAESEISSKTGMYVNTTGTYDWASGSSANFPSRLTYYYKFGGGLTWRSMSGKLQLYVGSTLIGEQSFSASSSAFKAASGTVTLTVASGNYPKANTVVFDQNPSDVTVPKTGTATTTFRTHLNDQYGVRVASAAGYTKSASLSSNRSSTTGITAAYGSTVSTYDPCTISVTNAAKLTTYDTNTITATASYTFNGETKTASKTFVVTDPTYTFSFDGNGGSISPNASVSKYYHNQLAAAQVPSSGTRTGYEFIAMYSDRKEPSYSFTKPVAGETEGYVDNLTDRTFIDDDTAWYAAWWAKDVTATFVDNDGNVVGTVTGKFDKTISEVAGEAVASLDEPAFVKRPGDTGTFDYVFESWVVDTAFDQSGNELTELSGQGTDEAVLKGDVTFRAQYAVKKNSYNVKFFDVDGSEISSTDYQYNDSIIQPSKVMTYPEDNTFNYVFAGWASVSEIPSGNCFLVDEKGYTEDGTYVAVSSASKVRGDAKFVPVFTRTYKVYKVSFTYDGITKTLTDLHWGDSIEVPTPKASYTDGGKRHTFLGWDKEPSATVNGNASYVAQYDVTDAVYTIRFFDYDGKQLNEGADQIAHLNLIPLPTATQTYRDEAYEYTFSKFVSEDGEVAGSKAAIRDVDFFAQYDKVELQTVNFFNGDNLLFSAKEVAGRAVPAFEGETPTKDDDNYATDYTFTKWADKDGNDVSVVPDGELNLYAQFDCNVIDYTVKFIRDDGTEVIPAQTLHYGDKVTMPTVEQRAKPADKVYRYEFTTWDNVVSATCQGDVTYKAMYRKSYVYYTVNWLDENGDVFKSENYIYNERINAPLTQPETSKAPSSANYEWVFDKWVLADDESVAYKRGDRIDANKTYKATYVETGKICTVNFLNDDGTLITQIKVAYGKKLSEIAVATPIKKSTADEHYNFIGWQGVDEDTIVTGDTDYTAVYEASAHSYALDEIKTAPTFFANGVGVEKCECGLTREVEIEKLADTVAPTSKLYVKDSTWTTETAADADFENAITVAPGSRIIINTNDTADKRDEFNPDGSIGSGVAKIEYSVQHGKVDAASITDSQWVTRFDYDATYEILKQEAITEAGGNETLLAQKLAEVDEYMKNLKANASGTLANIETYADGSAFVDGSEFVLYGKITDRLGNVSFVNSGKLVYDAVAPVVDVTSDHHNASKHCVDATITASDERALAKVTLNGTEITLTDGKYTVTEKGIYEVVATDSAGNTSKANFEIVGEHATKTYTVAPTCEVDGYQYDRCTLCGQEIGERIKIESMGHDFKNEVYTPATCEENGYTTWTCANCGEKKVVYDDPATTGAHNWVEIMRTDATCSAEGSVKYQCSICSKVKTEVLEINPDAHKYYYPITVKATCTQDGSITRTCRYCGYEDVEVIPATGHTPSGKWVVVTPATCTEEGKQVQYCANCDTTEVQAEETIPATGHSYKVKQVVEPTATEQGYTIYVCRNCDSEYKGNYVDPKKEYTVKFVVDGVETSITKVAGETVISTETPETVKAANETYKYNFSHWEDENGNTVKLPLTVEGDITLTAVFNESYVNYVITFVDENGKELQKIGYRHNGEEVTLPEVPEKADSAEYTFKGIGWKKLGADDSTASDKWVIAASDVTLVPVYEKTERIYSVVFAYDSSNIIAIIKVKGGANAVFPSSTNPTKEPDSKYHYVFKGWSKSLENVQESMFVTPIFDEIEHTLEITGRTEATCTSPATITRTCSCGYTTTVESGNALGHKWSDPYKDENGNTVKKCEVCGTVVDAGIVEEAIYVTITVVDKHGDGVSDVKVSLYDNGKFITSGTTGSDGKVTLRVPEAKEYTIVIEGDGFTTITTTVKINKDGSYDSSNIPPIDVVKCTCACHNDGLWGAIFRFFHKIIKMFTGEFKCCNNPDSRYYK